MANEKVLVPIIRPSAKSVKIGRKVAKRIRASEDSTTIGKDLAKEIKKA